MKIFNKKRVASIALAGALALSMAAPALAADTTLNATFTDPKITVTVSAKATAVINPYGLPYKAGTVTIKDQQIVTTSALTIQNKSEFAIRVIPGVTITVAGTNKADLFNGEGSAADGSGDFKFGSTTHGYTAADDPDKEMSISLEMFETDLTAESVAVAETLNSKFAALKSENAKLSVTPYHDGVECRPVGADESFRPTYNSTPDSSPTWTASGRIDGDKGWRSAFILREASSTGAAQKYGIGLFRLTGACAQAPDDPWDSTDKFTAAIAWTFVPDEYTIEKGTVAVSPASIATKGGTATATLTSDLPTGVTIKSVEWRSSNEDLATVAAIASDTTLKTATVTATTVGSQSGTVTIYAYVTGSDGLVYKSSATGASVSISTPA